jgi:DHA2 family multidrug resistance protein
MIAFRAGQGFTGGVFIPTAMTIVLHCLPKSKQPIATVPVVWTASGEE